jgi:hypothetical protein
MWWAGVAFGAHQVIQDRWCAERSGTQKHLITRVSGFPGAPPTQMAIPLHMEQVS